MNNDEIYKKNKNVWGVQASPMIQFVLEYLKPNGRGLDLGCGQGKETFFLLQKGFEMTAVDSSGVAIIQIQKEIFKKKIKNIEVILADISEYVIEKDKYDFIICMNVMQFIEQEKCLMTLKKIKEGIRKNGVVIISAFTIKDASFEFEKNKVKQYFKKDEMKEFFRDFKILHYFEGLIEDSGHAGMENSHKHGIVSIIAKKL